MPLRSPCPLPPQVQIIPGASSSCGRAQRELLRSAAHLHQLHLYAAAQVRSWGWGWRGGLAQIGAGASESPSFLPRTEPRKRHRSDRLHHTTQSHCPRVILVHSRLHSFAPITLHTSVGSIPPLPPVSLCNLHGKASRKSLKCFPEQRPISRTRFPVLKLVDGGGGGSR